MKKKKIQLDLAEAKLAYKVIFDRLSQNTDLSENDLENLIKIEKTLNRNIEFETKTIYLKKNSI